MRLRRNSLARDERGAALLTAIILMGALGAIAAVHALNVRASLRIRGVTAERNVGYYAAEGGLNVGMTRFANIFRNGNTPQPADFSQTLTLDEHDVSIALEQSSGCAPCPPTRIPIGEVFAGLNTLPYRYTVHATSARHVGEVAAHVAGEFDIHNIPIFQFLAFIDSHLFVMPLRDMTLHGRMHTNSDLYIQPDAKLSIEDRPGRVDEVQVTAAGDVYRGGRKYDASWRCWGDAYVDKLEDVEPPAGDLDPLAIPCATTSPLPDTTLDDWLGSLRAGVQNIVTPGVDMFDRGAGSYWKRADLRLVLRVDQRVPAVDFGAADLCPGAPNVAGVADLHPIEVQTAAGAQDVAKTRHLLRFLCERRGALFYSDLPVVAPEPPNEAVANLTTNYFPAFAVGQVYRRAGEDTSGNGVVDAADNNVDVCPAGPGAAPPWYNAATCPPFNDAPNLNRWYRDMDYRRGGFWNHREGQWMYLLNLNLRALIEWNQINGDVLFPHDDTTDGGLILFLTVQGADSSGMNNYGVRVFDSADLDGFNVTFPPGVADPTGVSVISDQLAIVQGNYNIRDKYPAAVMADAVHILSQGWEVPVGGRPNDLKSTLDLASGVRNVPANDAPGGTAFTAPGALGINAALLFGLGPSTLDPDWYNGGLENFIRMLESWSGRTLNYRGSFVSLGEPRHKRNDWHCGSGNSCNIYDPPVREFDYDPDFNLVENLPPMTPRFVYLQQRMYTRFYD